MIKRFLNPIQAIAVAGIVLVVAVLWILNTPQSQAPGGLTIQITPAPTRALRRTVSMTQVTPTLQIEQTRPGSSTEVSSQSHQTLTPTPNATIAALDLAYRTKQEPVADADLNCDSIQERVVSIDAYYGYPKADKTNRLGTIGVALQTPTQTDHRQVWEYWCDLKNGQPACSAAVALLVTDDCEQLITFTTRQQLIVFQWNGKDMSVALDAHANSYSSTRDPFVLTAIVRDHCTSRTKCDEIQTNYTWNGTEFVQE